MAGPIAFQSAKFRPIERHTDFVAASRVLACPENSGNFRSFGLANRSPSIRFDVTSFKVLFTGLCVLGENLRHAPTAYDPRHGSKSDVPKKPKASIAPSPGSVTPTRAIRLH